MPAALRTQPAGLCDLRWGPPCTLLQGPHRLLGSFSHNGVVWLLCRWSAETHCHHQMGSLPLKAMPLAPLQRQVEPPRAAVRTTRCKQGEPCACACTAAARWTAKAAVATIRCTHGADVWARATPGLLLRAGQGAVTLRVQSVEAGGCQLAAEVLTSGTLLTGQAVAAVPLAEADGPEGPPATASCPLLQLDAAQEQALHLLGAHEVTRPDFVAVLLQTVADARAVRQALDSAGARPSRSALLSCMGGKLIRPFPCACRCALSCWF